MSGRIGERGTQQRVVCKMDNVRLFFFEEIQRHFAELGIVVFVERRFFPFAGVVAKARNGKAVVFVVQDALWGDTLVGAVFIAEYAYLIPAFFHRRGEFAGICLCSRYMAGEKLVYDVDYLHKI